KSEYDVALKLAKACSKFTEPNERKECKAIVTNEESLLKLVQLVESHVPIKTIAFAIGTCKRNTPQSNDEVKPCTKCEEIVTIAQSYIQKFYTPEKHILVFQKPCQSLGPGKTVCLALAENQYKQFHDGLLNAIPANICKDHKACIPQSNEHLDKCSSCKAFVSDLRAVDRNQEVQDVIRSMVKSVCTELGPFQQMCDVLADQGLQFVFEFLATELDPTSVCESLELCAAVDTSNERLSILPQTKELRPSVATSVPCIICQLVLTEVESFLQLNSTETTLEKYMDDVCNRLPPTVSDECDSFVAQYAPMIVRLIEKKIQPDSMCYILTLCKNTSVSTVTRKLASSSPPNDGLCDLCKYVVTYIDTFLKENATENEIEEILDKVCQILPPSLLQNCTGLVQKYGPLIVQLLLQELDPTAVCTAIGLCTGNKASLSLISNVKTKVKGEMCDLCKYVLTYVDSFLGENATEAEIESLLEEACAILPSSVIQECNNFIEEYGPMIIQLLIKELDPSQVCTAIGLCAGNKVSLKSKSTPRPKVTQVQGELCDLCKYVLTYVDTFLGKNATEGEIEKLFEKACTYLPKDYFQKCDSLVQQYGPLIIQLLIQEVDPTLVCTAIKLCTGNNASPNLNSIVKTKKTKVKGELCDLCKYVLTYVDTFLGENATEVEIESLLKKACSFLPSSVTQECDSFIQQYGPMIIQLLIKELDPSQVCTVIGFCAGNKVPAKPSSNPPKEGLCDICKYIVTYIDNYLEENATEAEIEVMLDKVCDVLPSAFKDECESIVKQYGPIIIQLILKELDPTQVCTVIGLCTGNKVNLNVKPKVTKVRGELCDLCKYVLTYVDTYLGENATEAEIESLLEEACAILPSSLTQECNSFIQQYGPMIIQLLIKELDPSQVCTAIGFCAGNKVHHPVVAAKRAQTVKVSKESCALCEYIAQELDAFLAKSSTQTEIESAVYKVCTYVPFKLRSECDQFIQSNGPLIMQLLLQEVQPQQLCTAIKFCSATVKDLQQLVKTSSNPKCVLCEFIMTQLDNILAQNKSEAQIEEALEKVCSFMPETLTKECNDFVNTYGPLIIQMLIQRLEPDLICTYLKLCSSLPNPQPVLKKVRGPSCAICEFVIEQLNNILAENSTAAQIEYALEKVCDYLPSSLKAECEQFVQTYAPDIVKLLINKIKPEQICTALGLCSGVSKNSLPIKLTGSSCVMCEFIMSELDTMLAENSTEVQIQAALLQVCHVLPTTLKPECDSIIQQYTPIILGMLIKKMDPKTVCKLMHLCDGKRRVVSPPVSVPSVKKGELCPLCLYVFKAVDDLLEENATKEEVIAALDKVCDILPASIKDQCESFVGLYLPYVVDLIVQDLTPEQICEKLNLCVNKTKSASRLQHAHVSDMAVKKNELCGVCIYVFEAVYNMLSKNSSEAEIEAALDKVCNYLPMLKDQCDQIIALYTPYVVDLILKELSPQMICNEFGLCTNSTAPALVEVKKESVKSGDVECAICELTLKYLEHFVAKNASEKEIESALDVVCSVLPATVRKDCVNFVSSYTPTLVSLLSHFPPEQVCALIKACTAPPQATKPIKGGPECPLCEFIMQQLELLLQKNASEAQIEAALDKVCSFLPATIKQQCDSYVVAYTPILINLLTKMSPDQICSYLKFCTNSTSSNAGAQELKGGPECPLCEFIMQKLETLIQQNASEAQIEAALENVCSLLPATIKQQCDSYVVAYTPILINLLTKMSPDQICSYLKFCTNSSVSYKGAQELKGGPECPLCEFIMQKLETLVQKNASEQQIEAALEKVCSLLPATIKQECDSYVVAYTPILINLLTKMSPDQICSYLKFCTNSSVSYKGAQELKGGPECPLCEFIMQKLETLVQKNASEQQIEAALEKVCSLLPATIKQQCDSYVVAYTPILINLLTKMSPDQICSYLKFCTNSTTPNKELQQLKGGPECPLCEFVMEKLEELIQKNASEQQIEAALDKVCSLLPATVQQECDNYVKDYTPVLINLLTKMSADQICTYLKFCTNSTTASKEPQQLKGGPECPLCEFVMEKLEELIQKNASEQQIEAALDKVCSLLPTTVQQECDNYVKDYTPVLINLLTKMSPDQICTYLKFCTNSSSTSKVTTSVKSVSSGPYCVLCELILHKLDGFLSQNLTQSEIEKGFDLVCYLLPGSLKEECESFVALYEPVIMKLLLQETRPRQVCIAARICTNTGNKPASNALTFMSEKVSSDPPLFMPHCSLCKFALYDLQTSFVDPFWQTKWRDVAKSVCKLLRYDQDDCTSLIDNNYDTVVTALVAFRFPIEFCQKIELCEVPPSLLSKSNHKELSLTLRKAETQTIPSDLQYCNDCKFALFALQNSLSDPFWQVKFRASLDTLCTYLKTGQDICHQIVGDNIDNIISQITAYEFPIEFCQKLDFCESPPPVLRSNSAECGVCKVLVQLLDVLLQANSTLTEVEKVLNAACDSLIPVKDRAQCEAIVRNYTPALMQLISQLDDPTKVCQATKLCPKSETLLLKKMIGN
ncbi:proactivator polypeptide, partial [Biomphalaria glabrata]